MDTNSTNGSRSPDDLSKQEMKSKFTDLGFYTTETLLTTFESPSKSPTVSTSTYEPYYTYMLRRFKEEEAKLRIREFDEEERQASIERERTNSETMSN